MISLQQVRSLFDYSPFTGEMVYRTTKGRYREGDTAGTLLQNGYLRTIVEGRPYYIHRLAFFHFHGYLPDEIDHRDGVKTNNWIWNLRECGRSGNLGNTLRRRHNTSGFKGVFRSRDRWQAKISGRHIGCFDTPQEAAVAYDREAILFFGQFALTNKMMGLLK